MSEKKHTPAVTTCPNCDIEWDGALDTINTRPTRTAVVYYCAMHASAPDLLEALEGLLKMCNDESLMERIRPQMRRARAALLKARGE